MTENERKVFEILFSRTNCTKMHCEELARKIVESLALPSVVGRLFCEDCQKWVSVKCECGNEDLGYDATE